MSLLVSKTLLLEIDVQNDFCPAYSFSGEQYPDGALAVQGGGDVVASLNALSAAFAQAGARVAAPQDWHPAGHLSFASSHKGRNPGDVVELEDASKQFLWPDHCVQGGRGAAFHAGLNLDPVNMIIRKGFRRGLDSYSAFFENDMKTTTGLEGWIRGLGIDTVVIGGLATDYCVLYSAMDSRMLGFTTIIAEDAIRGVDYPAGSVEKAVARMREAGVVFCDSRKIIMELV